MRKISNFAVAKQENAKMRKVRDNYRFLTAAPVHHVILTMALPTIVSMLVTSIYNMADTYFVGKINTQCTAAVGVSFSVMAMIQAIGFFFGHGSGNYISRKLGARLHDDAARMAATGFFYSFGFGVVLAVAGHLFLTDLAEALGSTPTILPYTETYLGIVLLGAPFMTASFTMNNQMRFQGNALFAMVGIVSGAVLNVFLAPLLIFWLHMGIAGAATATLISQVCSFCILFAMTRRGRNIHIRACNFSPSLRLMREIVAGGTPSVMRQGLGSVATIVLNVAAGAFGDAAIAAMSIVGRSTYFVYSAIIGLGQGFQPLCGFCYGARLYDRVREGYMYCVKLGTAFLSAVAIVGYVFAGSIVEEFRHDADVVAVGTPALRWQLLTFPLIATVICSNMLLQTIRKPMRANLLAASRSGLFFIPLVITLPQWLGLFGLEICQAVADVCAFAVTLPVTWSAFRDMRA